MRFFLCCKLDEEGKGGTAGKTKIRYGRVFRAQGMTEEPTGISGGINHVARLLVVSFRWSHTTCFVEMCNGLGRQHVTAWHGFLLVNRKQVPHA
jgi:hypothetical protein